MNDSVRSAARVLDLLEYYAAASDGVALTTVAAAFGMPKSSTLALLRTLVIRGYVVRDEGGLYRLNDAFKSRGFGWGGDPHERLAAVARPAMDALSAELGETVILGVLGEDGQLRFLAKSVAQSVVRYDVDLRSVSPSYCTAMGRVLLSHLPKARREAILHAHPRAKLTPHTVVELDRVNAVIDQVAKQGYCIVEEEMVLGGIGVAMPICSQDGSAIAALDVGCVASRFAEKREHVLAALQACIAGLPPQFSFQPQMPAAATKPAAAATATGPRRKHRL